MKEKLCDHCGGKLSIRLPKPKSGCDHLYYPDNCPVCQSKRPTDTNKLHDEIDRLNNQISELQVQHSRGLYMPMHEAERLRLRAENFNLRELVEEKDALIQQCLDHHKLVCGTGGAFELSGMTKLLTSALKLK